VLLGQGRIVAEVTRQLGVNKVTIIVGVVNLAVVPEHRCQMV